MGLEKSLLDNLAKIRGNGVPNYESQWNINLKDNNGYWPQIGGQQYEQFNHLSNPIQGYSTEFNGAIPTLSDGPATQINSNEATIFRPIQGTQSKLSSDDVIKMTKPALSEVFGDPFNKKWVKKTTKEFKKNAEIEGDTYVEPTKPSFEDSVNKSFTGANALTSAANTAFTAIAGERSEFSGKEGALAKSLDSTYDTIQDAVSQFGPFGKAASLAMGVGKLVGNIAGKLGGGTDGMCVCAGTKVFTANGQIINIEDLQKDQGIIGYRESTKEIVPQLIYDFIEPRQKECVEITLKCGYTLKCSTDHPILSDDRPKARYKTVNGKKIAVRPWQFRKANELKVGDYVGIANNIDYWGSETLEFGYLVGLLIGDGSYGKGESCRIISADKETWDYLESNNLGVINHCDDSRPEKYSKEIRTYRIVGGMDLMHKLGISYQTGKNKTLPKNIGNFTKESVCNIIAGLFDSDGSINVNESKDQYLITLYQSNKDLLEEVRIQLHKLGIFSTINTRKPNKYELGGRVINSKESYRLSIGDVDSIKLFCELIPLNIGYKKDNLSRIYELIKDLKKITYYLEPKLLKLYLLQIQVFRQFIICKQNMIILILLIV